MSKELEEKLTELLQSITDACIGENQNQLRKCCNKLKENFGTYAAVLNSVRLAAVFTVLKNKRQFVQINELSEIALKFGIDDPVVRNIYALSLINSNQLMAADTILSSILNISEHDRDSLDLKESLGLRGRIWKDIALLAIDHGDLERAKFALQNSYDSYAKGLALAPLERGNLTWAGANLVGLAGIAEKHGLQLTNLYSGDLVEEVLTAISAADDGQLEHWDFATAIELTVCKEDWDQARVWLEKFIGKQPDAFHRATIERQLAHVWNINDTKRGAELYQILLNSTIKLQGGFISAESSDLKSAGNDGYQAYHGGEGSIHIDVLNNILRKAKSVALVRTGNQAIGTGFVLSGEDLGLSSHGSVLLTNSHVVSDPPQRDAARPGDVQLYFKMSKSSQPLDVGRILFNSGLDQHDVSILEILDELPEDVKPLRWASRPVEISAMDRAYVIGHPQGQGTNFSIENSKLIAVQNPEGSKPQRIHYRSATDFGNSGSPVFNQNWKVIGIHSRGRPSVGVMNGNTVKYSANEGITIESIVKRIRQDNKTAKQRKARAGSG